MDLSGTLLFFSLEIFTPDITSYILSSIKSWAFRNSRLYLEEQFYIFIFLQLSGFRESKMDLSGTLLFFGLEIFTPELLALATYCHQSNLGPFEMLHCIWRHSQFLLAKFSYFKGNSSASLPLTALMHKTKNNGNIVTSPYAILQR